MVIANIHEAKSQLSRLVEHAMSGEEVIIAKAGQPLVRLVPIHADDSPRVGGQWKGRVRIAEDFDTLPDDIAAFGIHPACPFHRSLGDVSVWKDVTERQQLVDDGIDALRHGELAGIETDLGVRGGS